MCGSNFVVHFSEARAGFLLVGRKVPSFVAHVRGEWAGLYLYVLGVYF